MGGVDQEIKSKLASWKSRRISREEGQELIPALCLNGAEPAAREYWDWLCSQTATINTTGRQLQEKTGDGYDALVMINNPPRIFRRSGALVRIEINENGQPVIQQMTESGVRGELARAALWIQFNTKGDETPVSPPLEVVRDLMTMPGGWPAIPALSGVTETPVIRPDGSILAAAGYDGPTRLFYYPDKAMVLPPIPDAPTSADLEAGRGLLKELFVDFPFDSPISEANILAALITPIVRPLITGPTPLCVIDKPQVGSGASLIATVIAQVTTGRAPAMMTAPRDPDEWRKTITSSLLEGRGIIVLDNLEGALYDSNLAAVLTATTYAARMLGSNQIIDLPNMATWIATGNNINLGGDLPRRAYLVHIDPGMARPWLRDTGRFLHPELEAWARDNRGRILAAVLTLARGWIVAGRPLPDDMPRLGGYESWVRVIGGILSYAGIKGFLANLMELYERNDTETPAWTAFVTIWHEILGEKKVTGKELQDAIQGSSEFEEVLPDRVGIPRRDNNGYIIDKGFTRRLGKQLAARKGRIYPGDADGDYLLDLVGSSKNALRWQVRKAKEGEFHPRQLPGFERKGEFGEFYSTSNAGGKMENIKSNNRVETNSPNSPVTPNSCVNQNSPKTHPPDGEEFNFSEVE